MHHLLHLQLQHIPPSTPYPCCGYRDQVLGNRQSSLLPSKPPPPKITKSTLPHKYKINWVSIDKSSPPLRVLRARINTHPACHAKKALCTTDHQPQSEVETYRLKDWSQIRTVISRWRPFPEVLCLRCACGGNG
ncbi:hypothetical protein CDAR_39651 [Caerostris darwini]|uniref:Noggin n=1 Tax=Caerostris darwini TaxID=1538125 RepID=A0AAV4U6G1_9ARAC|nr:hypothetical protein CDAR_39651 [Caerostris darwini]